MIGVGILVIIAVIALAIGLWAIVAYNKFIALGQQADNAWSDISVQLKRRHDLIPNLVETVKGYAGHEKTTFERVVQARGAAAQMTSPAQQAQAEGMLTQALRGLFALSERYPDLKASQNFMQMQTDLSALEEAIQNARRYYNAVIRDYNTLAKSVPTNIIAMVGGFKSREFFEIPDAQKEAPTVKFA